MTSKELVEVASYLLAYKRTLEPSAIHVNEIKEVAIHIGVLADKIRAISILRAKVEEQGLV